MIGAILSAYWVHATHSILSIIVLTVFAFVMLILLMSDEPNYNHQEHIGIKPEKIKLKGVRFKHQVISYFETKMVANKKHCKRYAFITKGSNEGKGFNNLQVAKAYAEEINFSDWKISN